MVYDKTKEIVNSKHIVYIAYRYKHPELNDCIISQNLKITYSHLTKIRKTLVEMGYMTCYKAGREKKVQFTDKAKDLINACIVLNEIFKSDN